jgi:aryl-alcohol dehydrogenase-like predicted oxidoreductase
MQYTSVGGFEFSKICLGTVALGMDYGISNNEGKPSKMECNNIFNTALAFGINAFDTAPGYGEAEQLVGDFLKNQTQKINIITKCTVSTNALMNKDLAKKEIFDSVYRSIETIGLPSIPICLFHKGFHQSVKDILRTIPAVFEDLKAAGLIDSAGISVNQSHETIDILEADIFEAIQTPINVFDQEIEKNNILSKLKQKQKIVFARSVFLQGLFFMSIDKLPQKIWHASIYLNQLQKIAKEANRSVADLVFSYVTRLEEITSIVIGVTSNKELITNVSLLNSNPLDEITIAKIRRLFSKLPQHIITPAFWNA